VQKGAQPVACHPEGSANRLLLQLQQLISTSGPWARCCKMTPLVAVHSPFLL
jgi:hypothetical protein